MPRRHYPWPDLRLLYVEGEPGEVEGGVHFPTLQEIADRFSLQVTKIRARAAREKWTEDREAFKARLEEIRFQARGQDMLKAIIDTDDRALASARIGAALVFNRVQEMEREAATRAANRAEWQRITDTARAAVGEAMSRGDVEEAARIKEASAAALAEIDYDPWAPPAVDARELSTLAQAAGNWHTLALKALGEPETRRIELTGADGGPVQVQSQTAVIYQELTRDDPARLHSLMAAFGRAVFADSVGPLALPGPDDGADQGDEAGGPA